MTAPRTRGIDSRCLVTEEDHLLAKLTAIAVALSVIDNNIPSFFLGIKPGLANIVVLVSWKKAGMKSALWISFLRIFSSGILLGSIGTPGFLLSLSGGTLSLVALKMAENLPEKYFSLISVSILSALAHYAGQILAVYALLIPDQSLLNLMPLFATAALITGYINGSVSIYLLNQVSKNEP